jgi:hypothetical protein
MILLTLPINLVSKFRVITGVLQTGYQLRFPVLIWFLHCNSGSLVNRSATNLTSLVQSTCWWEVVAHPWKIPLVSRFREGQLEFFPTFGGGSTTMRIAEQVFVWSHEHYKYQEHNFYEILWKHACNPLEEMISIQTIDKRGINFSQV